MIITPWNWNTVGEKVSLDQIDNMIKRVLSDINCNSLSFSGGIDSSLLLWHLTKIHSVVYTYTMGRSENHPDVIFSQKITEKFDNVIHRIYIPPSHFIDEEPNKLIDYPGDKGVRIFYRWLSLFTDEIIAGDGIDEFMAGYYDHQRQPDEAMYYNYLRRLQKEQLRPLNENSGIIRVNLPYIDERILYLINQIPLSQKVDKDNRKKIMKQLMTGKISLELFDRRKMGFIQALEDMEYAQNE